MISIVCPVYNEEKYIANLLNCYERMEPMEKELFLIDGQSTDHTRKIIFHYASKNPSIHLLDNPHRYVPFALNLAIPKCKGEIIVRWDAHTIYADNYLTEILATFERTSADIVGGPMRAIGQTPFQKAVAVATSSQFGVGNSSFHFEDYEGPADSVYLGAWKRDVFSRIGLFDEQMLRNQDDEFHYRARAAGLLIYQNPLIRSFYYPRESLSSLFLQYFGYGLYKPLVLQKVRSQFRFRHVVPGIFVAYLLLLPVWVHILNTWSFIPLFSYVLLLLIYSMRGETWHIRLAMLLVYPTLHIAYGLGFWAGLLKKPKS